MPVEIKELVVRAVVHESKVPPGGHGEPSAQASGTSMTTAEERTLIIRMAVKEVLRILKAAKER